MTIQDVKVCPFCGFHDLALRLWHDGKIGQVVCKTCGACGPFICNAQGATQDALARWDIRPGHPGTEPTKV